MKKYQDSKVLTVIDVYGKKKLRFRHGSRNIFVEVTDIQAERFKVHFPQRTQNQIDRFSLLDCLARLFYEKGLEDGKQDTD